MRVLLIAAACLLVNGCGSESVVDKCVTAELKTFDKSHPQKAFGTKPTATRAEAETLARMNCRRTAGAKG